MLSFSPSQTPEMGTRGGYPTCAGGGSRSPGITSSHEGNPPAAPRAHSPTAGATAMANEGNRPTPGRTQTSIISLNTIRNWKHGCFGGRFPANAKRMEQPSCVWFPPGLQPRGSDATLYPVVAGTAR